MAKKVAKKAAMPAKNADGGAKKPIVKGVATAIGGSIDPVPTNPLPGDDVTFTCSAPDATFKFVTVSVEVTSPFNLSNFDFAARGRKKQTARWYPFDRTVSWANDTEDTTGEMRLTAPFNEARRTDFDQDEIVITIITKKKVK